LATETISEQVKQYLLGTLSPEEKSRFEEKYFDDDKLFEEIEIVEDELIDAYVREELSTRDRERFKEVVNASPRLTSRVDFARILVKSTSAEEPATVTAAVPTREESQSRRDIALEGESFWRRLFTKSPAPNRFGWAMAACTLLLLLGGGMLLFEWMRLRAETTRLALERAELEQRNKTLASELDKQSSELSGRLANAQAENDRLLKQLESSQKETPESKPKNLSVAFFIAPGGLRSTGGENRITISSKFPEVRLNLGLESNDYSSYNATVQTVEGKTVLSRDRLRAQARRSGNVVELKVPTSQLPNGTYIVELTGRSTAGVLEPVMKYSFRVVRN
jgi:hypothetical protein